jgi:hypothetical protein
MKSARLHLFVVASLASLTAALLMPWFSFGWQVTPRSVAAVAFLASPFIVLIVGHLYLCATWRRGLLVALLNLPLWFAWSMGLVAMWYFQPGMGGAMVIGVLLSVLAGLGLLLARLIREDSYVHA